MPYVLSKYKKLKNYQKEKLVNCIKHHSLLLSSHENHYNNISGSSWMNKKVNYLSFPNAFIWNPRKNGQMDARLNRAGMTFDRFIRLIVRPLNQRVRAKN
jgi:hypothetical protein